MKGIQRSSSLETLMGRHDIYIDPETYTHVLHVERESPLSIGCLILETDLWRAWAWMGSTWARKRSVGLSRTGFRRKTPYTRLVPEAIVASGGIVIRRHVDGGIPLFTLDYHDAVDPVAAMAANGETRILIPHELVESSCWRLPDGSIQPRPYTDLLARAHARLTILNGMG